MHFSGQNENFAKAGLAINQRPYFLAKSPNTPPKFPEFVQSEDGIWGKPDPAGPPPSYAYEFYLIFHIFKLQTQHR